MLRKKLKIETEDKYLLVEIEMRTKLFYFFLIFCSLTISGQQENSKPRIAVYMTGNDAINEIVANKLMSDLLKSGKYQPIERSGDFLAAVSKEHSFERNGTVDDDEIARLGKQFGLKFVCVVSIVDVWQNEKYISAHIIDVNTVEVIGSFSSNGTVSSPDKLMSALADLSTNLKKVLDYTNYAKNSVTSKVAVYVTRTGNRDVDIILGDQLVSGFAKSKEYIAVERTNAFLKHINMENKYQQSGAVDNNEQMAELGRRFGVKYVCVAKTTVWNDVYFISTRLINVETAEAIKIYNAENVKFNSSQDVIEVSEEIASELAGEGRIFEVVEKNAEFPGGEDACFNFLRENVKYPAIANEEGIQGLAVVLFVVEKDGSITDIKVVSEECYYFGEKEKDGVRTYVKEATECNGVFGKEAIRVVKLMPRWKPARQGTKPVRSRFTLPFNFRLQ